MRVSMVNSVICGLALARMPGLLLTYRDLVEEKPASSGWWLFGIVSIFILAFAVSLCVFLSQAQRSKCRQVCSVEISNEGNERDSYELQVEDPSGALEFTFVLRGAKLPQKKVAPLPVNVLNESAPDARPSPAGSKAARKSDKDSGGATGIKRWMMGIASAVVALLTAVGSLLPQSIRAPVLQFATKIRAGQTSVRRVEQAPRRIARAARMSKSASSQVGSKQPAKGAVVQDVSYAETETFGVFTSMQTWARTPAVEPGSLLSVDLLIDPVNPYQPGINLYPFVVKSRSIQQPEGTLVIEQGEAQITGITRIQRYGPMLIVFAVAIVVISIIAVLVF